MRLLSTAMLCGMIPNAARYFEGVWLDVELLCLLPHHAAAG